VFPVYMRSFTLSIGGSRVGVRLKALTAEPHRNKKVRLTAERESNSDSDRHHHRRDRRDLDRRHHRVRL